MASTTTKFFDCPPGTWTELVDGATYASCQIAGDGVTRIAVGAAAPADDSGDYMKVGQWPPLSLDLQTGDKVYGQPSLRLLGGVRIVQVSRA